MCSETALTTSLLYCLLELLLIFSIHDIITNVFLQHRKVDRHHRLFTLQLSQYMSAKFEEPTNSM